MVGPRSQQSDEILSYVISKWVKREYNGCTLHPAIVGHCFNTNLAGISPLKVGGKGGCARFTFKSLCMAFESYIWICQINPWEGKTQMGAITERMLWERIELLSWANMHGKNFFVMSSSHVCSDDLLKAQPLVLAMEEDIAKKMK
jgi:hypothetical protein